MYNIKDIQFAGKHDYNRKAAEYFSSSGAKTFSINIFQWVLKSNGKEMKQAKGKVRVSGSVFSKENVFAMAENIVKQLDAGEWDGRKTVSVK